jgi:riboflavin kinase/FMN adenylyltransferase
MFRVHGKVRHGKKRGRKLGFPTANTNLHKEISQGIYVSETLLSGKIFKSISFLGNAKTFGEKIIQLETHILDFNQDIYGRIIYVRLIKKIRENENFESVQKLIEQMEKDVKIAKDYFKDVQRYH